MEQTEDRVSEFEDRSMEINQSEKHRGRKIKETKPQILVRQQ